MSLFARLVGNDPVPLVLEGGRGRENAEDLTVNAQRVAVYAAIADDHLIPPGPSSTPPDAGVRLQVCLS